MMIILGGLGRLRGADRRLAFALLQELSRVEAVRRICRTGTWAWA